MTINNVCYQFKKLWKDFHDESNNSGKSSFKDIVFRKYCPNDNCDTNIKKINAGCLWLFNAYFGQFSISLDLPTYKDAVVCIMIWLSYKLNQKSENGINTLKDFYSKHIENNEKYTKSEIYNKKFKGYKEIIDEIKEYLDIDISHMSKFYELLKLLCSMDTAYTKNKDSEFMQDANKFVEKYQELLDGDNNTDNSIYSKVLLVLSKYYNNFESLRVTIDTEMARPQLPSKKTAQKVEVEISNETKTTGSSSETGNQDIETITLIPNTALSDSSLASKLIPVLSIFGAIAIFLGISYKYSLFGFRKRSQKQHLKEKLKK
ncbi:hypothetical protein YYC_05594 [Plasmodium yoelii 17X]|uniref:Bir1 protein n=4 Tax=Plasmodium yoelii TaxID=5861 RepID=Q7R9W7_PLAYO|nr:uncharacterized protein PY17X_1373600 [Plasmodium yoelii]EAA19021.1 putative bir1 protein [Plasmodium yoelii yoelii]ETB56449.1 hypothetical protein YYC_05594 [Plasmodium yoelii 17X]WBY60496.1 PIR protein [Plasmodium yoelii yoelii]VTZ81103.1 PIR protein [Plasmodium yoelii]|eukprot:XP_727456.1 uncharacterized protein PY17X_1373600 [Plasmodium yoelii]